MKVITLLSFLLIFALSSCEEATTEPDPIPVQHSNMKYVTGTVFNPNDREIPEDSKLVLMWHVLTRYSSYQYITDAGTFDKQQMTFRIDFSDFPIDSCLNKFKDSYLGVATFLMVEKDYPLGKYDRYNGYKSIGWAINKSIVFASGSLADIEPFMPWIIDFPTGYNLANGVYDGSGRDGRDGWALADTNDVTEITLIADLKGDETNLLPDWK